MTIIKSPEEIAIMRQAGKILATILQKLKDEVKPGVKMRRLDSVAAKELKKYGAKASFKNYRGFPSHLCVSVNDEIVHGIPDERCFNEGDIVSLDFGVNFKGFHSDSAVTIGVGKISPQAQELLTVTEAALMAGVGAAHSGAYLGDVSASIQKYAEARGMSVIREYSGHGIGRDLHEDPLVPNFGLQGEGPLLQKGMTIAVEPMLAIGNWMTRLSDNGWTVFTADGSLSAHFEHTIAIGDNRSEILTIS